MGKRLSHSGAIESDVNRGLHPLFYVLGVLSLIPILGLFFACLSLIAGFLKLREGGWKLHLLALAGLIVSGVTGPAIVDSVRSTFPILAAFSSPPASEPAGEGAIRWREPKAGLEEAQRTGKPVLLDFTAAWCGWCHRLEADVFNQPENAKYISDHFIPIRVVDRSREEGRNPEAVAGLQGRYGVRGFPTLVVASPDLNRSDVFGGYAPSPQVMAFLKNFAGR